MGDKQFEPGVVDYRFHLILDEYGIKPETEYWIYKRNFVEFYDKHPFVFTEFVKKSVDDWVRKRFQDWAAEYGIKPIYIESVWNVLHAENFAAVRVVSIERMARELVESGVAYYDAVDRMTKHFNIGRTYARDVIRRVTGRRQRRAKRELQMEYKKLVREIVGRGYELRGVVHSNHRWAVLEFYNEQPKQFWDFFEMDIDTIVAYRPVELAKMLGAKNTLAVLGLFRLRFGKSWMEARTEKINRELANWVMGRYSRERIIDILTNEYGLKPVSAKNYLFKARRLI